MSDQELSLSEISFIYQLNVHARVWLDSLRGKDLKDAVRGLWTENEAMLDDLELAAALEAIRDYPSVDNAKWFLELIGQDARVDKHRKKVLKLDFKLIQDAKRIAKEF